MVASQPKATPYVQLAFPDDPGLPELPRLFDHEWAMRAYGQRFGDSLPDPSGIRIRQFAHSRGRSAIVSYELEWDPEEYLPSQRFAIRIEKDQPAEIFRYPDDRVLPGLSEVAHPETALALINRHVLSVRARRVRVQLVRYRPASRAVLRHIVGRARLYARVMRPEAVAPVLTAQEIIGRSSFVVPRLAGRWTEGGVIWFSEIPGRNMRQQIRRGRIPDPEPLLDGLQTLWDAPQKYADRPFNLPGAYRRARRSFRHNLRDNSAAMDVLNDATEMLDPFMRSWRPSSIAHNDFYDDQMLVLSDGRVALVDFEEAGLGDPMLDVGNFLAHLRWATHFGRGRENDASGAFHQIFRNAALDRFGWDSSLLALREAVCLFRICTNVIRRPQPDWDSRLESGLRLVNEIIG